MPHLVQIGLKGAPTRAEAASFPFNVPAVRSLPVLDVEVPVTLFVGENGSGKSTLLEAIAAAAELPALGAALPDATTRGASLIVKAADAGAQFIIATHSPIFLACPGARIFCFDGPPIHEAAFAELEHVNVMRDFLNDPAGQLERLLAEEHDDGAKRRGDDEPDE